MIRFFESHPWLLSDPRFAKEARLASTARTHLAAAGEGVQARLGVAAKRDARAASEPSSATLASRAPRETAICHVFGAHCQQALRVARCESGLRTTAQNGQYLGLFQMGSSERRLFGHGATASRRRRRRTGTSSSPAVTGARGRASPGLSAAARFVRKVRYPAGRPGSQERNGW